MSRGGGGAEGESVWLGWLFRRTVDMFEPIARQRDPLRARRWREHADRDRGDRSLCLMGNGIAARPSDDGTWLGSSESEECRIDSIAQSWAVLSGRPRPNAPAWPWDSSIGIWRGRKTAWPCCSRRRSITWTMIRVTSKAIHPACARTAASTPDAAPWAVLAYTKMGDGDKAAALVF